MKKRRGIHQQMQRRSSFRTISFSESGQNRHHLLAVTDQISAMSALPIERAACIGKPIFLVVAEHAKLQTITIQ
jgi:hypothetical protein